VRVAKCHPQLGWLRLEARDYSRSLDRLLLERDKLADPSHSGPAPEYLRWVAEVELPELARRPYYADQIEAHLADLARQEESLQADLSRQAPDLAGRLQALEAEVKRLEEVLS